MRPIGFQLCFSALCNLTCGASSALRWVNACNCGVADIFLGDWFTGEGAMDEDEIKPIAVVEKTMELWNCRALRRP
jgi:hypothetical protein